MSGVRGGARSATVGTEGHRYTRPGGQKDPHSHRPGGTPRNSCLA